MAELFAAVCSITPTRRRRFLWAAWWTAPPARDPFRKPDAASGGARSREDALREAERAAGRPLVEIEPRWARAYARVLQGQPPWPRATSAETRAAGAPAKRASKRESDNASVWTILGVGAAATVEEIKRAYRARALETHPDRGGSAEEFRALQRAYERAIERAGKPRRRRKRA